MTLFLARLISFISHPYVLIVFGTYIVLIKETGNLHTAIVWTFAALIFNLIVLVFELIGIKKGLFSNFDISKRKQRTPFFLFVLLILAAFMITAYLFNAPIGIIQEVLGGFIGISIILLVNRKVKASIHLAVSSSLLLTIVLLYGNIYLWALLFIPAVAWSRVKLRRHTVRETVYGAGLGLGLTALGFVMISL